MELVISNLSKVYPNGVRALHDVSLTIPSGMFGLLGPNGAGKSTLMRTIATLQDPDGGSIRMGDLDVLRQKDEVRRVLGYLPQEFGFYPNLSAEAILDHFATLKGLTDGPERRRIVASLLQQTNLYEQRKKSVGGFSGGMKQRLGIATALLGDPQLIIVDEPTAGLDPTERNRFLNLLSEISESIIVIFSTHIVEDVRELCQNMAVIARGEVVTQGTPADVVRSTQGRIWKRTAEKSELVEIQKKFRVISTRLLGGRPVVHVYSEGPPGDGFAPAEGSLEDAFFFHLASPVEAV